MSIALKGLTGANPLGFLAAVGLLRLLSRVDEAAQLGFTDDGALHAWVTSRHEVDVAGLVADDAAGNAGPQPWRLEYEKAEKKGTKVVADLKAPPEKFAGFLQLAIREWIGGDPDRAEYAAAFGTDVAVDGKGNTKPTAFHFTAANQQFLGAIEETRRLVSREWVEQALHAPGQVRPGANVRWDPDAERNRALMGANPTDDGTVVNAPLEWLAFRALPAFPCVPVGTRNLTVATIGKRQDDLQFRWPLWSCGASYDSVRSLLASKTWSADRLNGLPVAARRRGVFAVCSSEIRRTAQGFGNFGPPIVLV